MSALRYIRLVLWSFFGIRRRVDAMQEINRSHPLPLVITAVLLALVLIGLLVGLASLATWTLK